MSVVPLLSLPSTGSFSFCQLISSVEHYQLLSTADVNRARVRDVLKRAKRNNNKDSLEVVKALEDYIPYLFSIKDGLEAGGLQLDHEIGETLDTKKFQVRLETDRLVTSWRMPFSGSSQLHVVEPQRVELPTIYFEVFMSVLTYALSLLTLAEEVYQTSSAEDKWKQATTHLLLAQSILVYLSTHSLQLNAPVPLDLQASTFTPIINLISGSLHLLVIYKSLSSSTSSSSNNNNNNNNNKPLSAGLMARISIFAQEKFGTALSLLPSNLQNHSIETWIQDANRYSTALAAKYLAIERNGRDEVGRAIALCVGARNAISSISVFKKSKELLLKKSTSNPFTSSASKNPYSNSFIFLKDRIVQLDKEIEELEKQYRTQNDRISFQAIADVKDVMRSWPSGREVVAAKSEWEPSKRLIEWDNYSDNSVQQGSKSQISYSGQGSYY
ncbi:hypothetical protein V1514DRAFT_318565 [Lipomyces japonicus]|uniref:uncharacterized protein n=1 Tax=Lipomyces japonicus TaxID=56871 RepID=UPI0034CD4660